MSLEKPNFNDAKDRELYNILWDKDPSERTEEEDIFLKTIYHQEEFASGLDG